MEVQEFIEILKELPPKAEIKINGKPLLKGNIRRSFGLTVNLFEPDFEECKFRAECPDYGRKLGTEKYCVRSFECKKFRGVGDV
ncbi:hypothetical protein [Maridesulfovibrio ferrireducens]|uniref:hypothetical protein n=1 Tax=Maridesulfovibrio ferrireducens TaxID=246191 RepID=UPI001A200139|nr:hypothetical protein [Maridesulfovibrio ferrireducens]MBI9110021.1 hypothetical protein [Maridesulfovibrio ferrireducens]